jgi:hypothetical protein
MSELRNRKLSRSSLSEVWLTEEKTFRYGKLLSIDRAGLIGVKPLAHLANDRTSAIRSLSSGAEPL